LGENLQPRKRKKGGINIEETTTRIKKSLSPLKWQRVPSESAAEGEKNRDFYKKEEWLPEPDRVIANHYLEGYGEKERHTPPDMK